MVKKYRSVIVGGTFDHLHRGHKALLSKAFEVGSKILIGVTSDDFATKLGKMLDCNYATRVEALKAFLDKEYGERSYRIYPLNDYFGPYILSKNAEAIVVSEETAFRVRIGNDRRRAKGLKPLRVFKVKMVLAQNGLPISSTRIRSGEIDVEGRSTSTRKR